MAVLGFVFICAFDPIIVGEVLGHYHSGFGNGLKFLDKIIDYPRWLPQPTISAIRSLAHAEINKYCQYVPLTAMDDILPFMPQSPRIVKQVIRLLALLKPQIDRHYEHELVWPAILSANILKVLYPQIAQDIFVDDAFWDDISDILLMRTKEKNGGNKVKEVLSERLKTTKDRLNIKLTTGDEEKILNIFKRISEFANPWIYNRKLISYQMHIAESPHAVTWKEYDELFEKWLGEPNAKTAEDWLNNHVNKIGHNKEKAYLEVLSATISSRGINLNKIADSTLNSEMKPLFEIANAHLTLLEQLVFDIGGISLEYKMLGEVQIKEMISSLFCFLTWSNKNEYRKLREREKKFLLRLVKDWYGDVTPFMNILNPFMDSSDPFSDEILRTFKKQLCDIVVLRFANQVLKHFGGQGFIQKIMHRDENNYNINRILLDIEGVFWRGMRKEAIAMFKTAEEDENIQMNAVKLCHWFDYKLKSEPGLSDTIAVEKILGDKMICTAIWNAATVTPLNPRYVGHLRDFPARVKKCGVLLKLPHWWKRALKELGVVDATVKPLEEKITEQKSPATDQPGQ